MPAMKNRQRIRTFGLLGLGFLVSLLGGCDRASETASSPDQRPAEPAQAAEVRLIGAGATFPQPLYSKWAAQYNRIDPKVNINYQAIGSGGGIKQITEKTVDFGATDGPMTDAQLSKASGEILHIPMTLGAVVAIYNLPEVKQTLTFSGPVLADIFLGKITRWNDPRLSELNPEVKLPDLPITVVHRSDGSGTTYIFTDYLAKISDEWASGPGRATTVNWPTGRGAKGNDGVAADVKQNVGSLGYVELIYAANNDISHGNVINRAGQAVHASAESVSAAAVVDQIADDLRISLTDATGKQAYPISGMTWILIYKQQPEAAKGKALLEFLWWATHEGQSMATGLHYAPLPADLIPRIEAKLRSVTADNKPLLSQ